jgi:hypothetical protein
MEDAGVDPVVKEGEEQIVDNGIRKWLNIKRDMEGDPPLSEMFLEEACNLWECESCAHLEARETDEVSKIEKCSMCGKRKFKQRRTPIKWLWKPVPKPESCDLLDVYNEVSDFVRNYVYIEEDAMYDLVTAWVIASWKMHRIRVAPYLLMVGTIETGKTKLLEVLAQLSYHAIGGVSITSAAVSRIIEQYNATVLIDQAEKLLRLNTDAGISMYSICLSGYRKGMYYTVASQDGENVISRNVFSLKAFASERVFDTALTSRCITIRMHRGQPKEKKIDEKGDEWAKRIRGMLLYYHYLNEEWDKVNSGLNGRNEEIYEPLLQVIQSAGRNIKPALDIANREYTKRMEEMRYAPEGIIIKALLSECDNQQHVSDLDGMYVMKIAEATGIGAKEIGWKLKNMGISRLRDSSGKYVPFTNSNTDLLEKLAAEYGVK